MKGGTLNVFWLEECYVTRGLGRAGEEHNSAQDFGMGCLQGEYDPLPFPLSLE